MEKAQISLEIEKGMDLKIEVSDSWDKKTKVKEDSPGFYNQTRDFSEAVQIIRPLVDKVLQPLKTLERRPDEISLNFGFSFTKNSELILKEGGKEAHIQVNLTFKDESKGE
ncbi:MAG: CU044_2847 family protein [SAR324 cluster bacterium]|nr:CU044_2847 family protein [SAR324 cluster bacterium]